MLKINCLFDHIEQAEHLNHFIITVLDIPLGNCFQDDVLAWCDMGEVAISGPGAQTTGSITRASAEAYLQMPERITPLL